MGLKLFWKKKKTRVGSITLPSFKIYYKTTEIKTVILAKRKTHRSMKQNVERSIEIGPHK